MYSSSLLVFADTSDIQHSVSSPPPQQQPLSPPIMQQSQQPSTMIPPPSTPLYPVPPFPSAESNDPGIQPEDRFLINEPRHQSIKNVRNFS